jgi:tRNA(Ile)-lysidine synthase
MARLESALAQSTGVAVAYSGGRDSTALLHATLHAAAPLGVRVWALHVHHGLSAHADAWLAHCRAQCTRWRRQGLPVTFRSDRLRTGPGAGDSVEAWARRQRYCALRSMALANGISLVLLAHHRLDQAETLLLQALRGAGVAGLAGMPRSIVRDGVTWTRPWLDEPAESIEAYVEQHRLQFVDDDSNVNPRFARNRLRAEVWPALRAAFADADTTLAAAAQWAQQASQCLDELAEHDLRSVGMPAGLDVTALRRLSTARQGNALRAWLKAELGTAATASLVTRLVSELHYTRSASWPCPEGSLRLYRGVLSHAAATQDEGGATRVTELSISHVGVYRLTGWDGRLRVTRTTQGGVPLAWLARLDLRPRIGGERFQAGIGRPPRSLKKQYQAASIPAWLRDGPLIYSGGQLIFVPGLGVDARARALPGQAQVSLEWLPRHDAAKAAAEEAPTRIRARLEPPG